MAADVIVVGAGAWGLPAALQLQDRGHRVTLIERFETGGPFASSGGETRLWRLADPQVWRSRAMALTLPAMERLSERLGTAVYRTTGMVWRDDVSLPLVTDALRILGEPFVHVASQNVGGVFPGLRPDHRDALYVPNAGVVLTDILLGSTLRAFIEAGGEYVPRTRVTSITPRNAGGSVSCADGRNFSGDQVLLTAGPGAPELLPGLGVRLPLRPYIEQVVHFGDPSRAAPVEPLPGLFDGPVGEEAGIYAMSGGAAGYKIGLDAPLRPLREGTLGDDLDRQASSERTETLRARVARDLASVPPIPLTTQVCTWTDSGDGDFIVGRTHESVVLACGDSGEGFKFSAFMGEYLAELVEGGSGNPEFQEHWRPSRFEGRAEPRDTFDAIGRH